MKEKLSLNFSQNMLFIEISWWFHSIDCSVQKQEKLEFMLKAYYYQTIQNLLIHFKLMLFINLPVDGEDIVES